MDPNGKVALVTGGAGGIGLCIAKSLLENGASVVLFDMSKENGEETARNLEVKYGEGKVHFTCGNVTKQEDVEGALKEAIHKFSRLDILVNNAGIGGLVPWEDVIDVNLKGVLRVTNEALNYMSKGTGGHGGVVVNVASIAALIDFPYSVAYSASKNAVIGLTRSLGHPEQYKDTGVRFFAVCPGYTETNLGQKAKREMIPKVRDYFKKEIIFQKPEFVGASVAELVRSAPNGSIWVVEEGEPAYQISIPDYKPMKITSV